MMRVKGANTCTTCRDSFKKLHSMYVGFQTATDGWFSNWAATGGADKVI